MSKAKHPFYFVFFFLLMLTFGNSYAQGSSNKGTDFWLGYGNHISTGNMVLYITSDVNTTSTITIPSLGFSQTVNIIANAVQSVNIPTLAHLTVDGKSANGIHVTSLKPVIVYAHIYAMSVSGATLVLPTNTLGKDYYSINYKQVSNQPNCASYFFVVAVEDNSEIEIIPSQATQGGWAANSTNVVKLNKGEIYNVLGTISNVGTSASNGVDLTGSRIRSISSSGTCKKIAVFSGSSKIAINCLTYSLPTTGNPNPGSADNLFQQVYPTATWGKNFITVPQKDRNFVVYRIVKSDPSAIVTLNGIVIPSANFINNFYYDFDSQKTDIISSDKPIQTVQYAVTQNKSINCGTSPGDVGDPEMIFLNPLEQTLTQITMYSTPNFNILKHFINVVVKNEGVASFKVDGVSVAASFLAVPSSSTYSYAQLAVTSGTHNLVCNEGFNATAYGFGSAESYGYAAGANLTAFGIEPFQEDNKQVVQTGCVGQSYSINLRLPYQAIDIYLDKGDGNGEKQVPLNLKSQTTVDGQTTYSYLLTQNLIFTIPKTYSFKVRVIKPTLDNCGAGDEFSFDLIINPKSIANFTAPEKVCLNELSTFVYVADPAEPLISNYLWDFNGEGTSTLKDPTFKFLTSGTKTVKFSTKTNLGCWSDVVEKSVEIIALPVVKFLVSSPTCETKDVVFTNQSTTLNGVINKWEWIFDDTASGAANTSILENPTHVFATAKTYNVSLKVTTDLGCIQTIIQPVTINPLPKSDFESPNICINNPTATFTNKTVINGGSSLTYIWDFGDPVSGVNNTSILVNPIHIYSKASIYKVKLIAKSAEGCDFEIIKDIIIYPKPEANFTSPPKVCLNDVSGFTYVADPAEPAISNYLWDFNGEGISTLKDPTFKFLTSGTKKVKFSTKSSLGCWSDVVEKQVEIFALPTPSFITNAPACETKDIKFTDQSTTIRQTIVKWDWNFDDPTSTNNTSSLQNPIHTFSAAKIYNVTLTVTTDLGCAQVLIKQIVINPQPKVDFETPEICLDDALAIFTNKTTIEGNTALTYLWDFGDLRPGSINTSTLKNPSHKYIAAANYIVKLVTTSDKGCVSELIKTFTVNGSTPKALFIPQNENTLCVNQPVIFKDTSTIDFGEITKIVWYYDDATPNVFEVDENPNSRSMVAKKYSHNYPIFYTPAQRSVNVKMVAYSGNSATCVSSITKTIILKAAPIANFTTPDGCLPNGEAQFNDASIFLGANTGFTYLWDFGDAGSSTNTSTLKNPTHVYTRADNYLVKLIATSSNGCSSELIKTFTVIGSVPKSKFIVKDEGVLCSDKPVVFEEKATVDFGELAKVEWIYDDSNPTVIETDNKPGLRSASSKVYTHLYPVFYSPAQKVVNVKMIAYSGSNASCTSEFLYAITLRAIPIPNFTMPNGCLPKGEAQFNNQSTFNGETNGLTYSWDFGEPSSGSNNSSSLKDPIHQYKNAGNYVVNLTTTYENGCSATLSKTFVVNGAVAQPAFTVLNEKDLCSDNAVVFNDVALLAFGELNKIEWFFDNDNQANNPSYILTDNNPALRSEVTKSYSFLYPIFNSPISKIVNVKMKLYSGNGCESEIIKSIILKALPNVLFNNMPPVCEEVIPFQITQATETTGFIGTGIFSGKGISNTGLFSPAVAGVGTHTITFTFNGDNGCTDEDSKDIIVYPTPTADAGTDETILIGGNIKFNATASGNNITYKWSPSVGLDNDAILNPTAAPLVDTEYTLTITSENGCEVADKVFITVLKYPEIPNTFTPNGDGVNDTWEIKYLGSYPNSTIMIFNRYGKDVYNSESYTAWDGKLNGTNLPDGMYYYIITANSGQLKYTGSVMIIR